MSKSCPKCRGRLEQGFVPEAKWHSTKVETWFEGAAKKSWAGITFRGLRQIEIETWRFSRCADLESYAPAS